MKKRQIVLADKAKIAAVIEELDEKKKEAIKKVYTQVTKVTLPEKFEVPYSSSNTHRSETYGMCQICLDTL